MKKLFTTLVGVLVISQLSYGQNSNPWPTSGNVGIGIATPYFPLDVWGIMRSVVINANGDNSNFIIGNSNAAATTGDKRSSIWLDNDGRLKLRSVTGYGIAFRNTHNSFDVLNITDAGLGVGTTNPLTLFHVAGPNAKTSTTSHIASFLSTNDASAPFGLRTMLYGAPSIDNRYVTLQTTDYSVLVGGSIFLQPAAGNVGIGTTTPNAAFKLSVNGSIRSKEIKVETAWSDYVFNDDYKLKTIPEVEAYIKSNHHLPDVPSAAEVEKNGVALGETSALLLKKIEELTLYLIEKDKQLKEQSDLLKKQQDDINQLKQYIKK